jgi:hypothetical protein
MAQAPTAQQIRVMRKLAARTGTSWHIDLAIDLGVTYESAMDTISRQWAKRHTGIRPGPYA